MRKKEDLEFNIGILIIVIIVLFSFLGPIFYKVDPDHIDLLNISVNPNKEYLLGTDELGRDMLSRLMYGGRISITIGIFATSLKILISLILGTISGYYKGIVDNIIMRIADIIMCFPFYIL